MKRNQSLWCCLLILVFLSGSNVPIKAAARKRIPTARKYLFPYGLDFLERKIIEDQIKNSAKPSPTRQEYDRKLRQAYDKDLKDPFRRARTVEEAMEGLNEGYLDKKLVVPKSTKKILEDDDLEELLKINHQKLEVEYRKKVKLLEKELKKLRSAGIRARRLGRDYGTISKRMSSLRNDASVLKNKTVQKWRRLYRDYNLVKKVGGFYAGDSNAILRNLAEWEQKKSTDAKVKLLLKATAREVADEVMVDFVKNHKVRKTTFLRETTTRNIRHPGGLKDFWYEVEYVSKAGLVIVKKAHVQLFRDPNYGFWDYDNSIPYGVYLK